MTLRMIFAGLLLALGSMASHGTVLDFENLSPGQVQDGYGDLNWENWGLMPKSTCQYGYCSSVTSGGWSVYNWGGADASVSSSELFNFEGAYLTGAFHDDLLVNVKGYKNGQLAYDETVGVNTVAAQWFAFNFNGIDELVFSSFGPSVQWGVSAEGNNFAMDDFSFSRIIAVSEPGSLALLGLGLAFLVGVRRKS